LDSGAPAIRQVSFTAAGESVTLAVKDKAGVDLLVAPRRDILDRIGAGAATRAGVHIRPGVTVTGVRLDEAGRAIGVYAHRRSGAHLDREGPVVGGGGGLG